MHRRIHNFTYVSSCVKYMIFLLNFIFWLFGGLLIAIGFYAFVEKWQATGSVRVETIYDVMLNISLVMIIAGLFLALSYLLIISSIVFIKIRRWCCVLGKFCRMSGCFAREYMSIEVLFNVFAGILFIGNGCGNRWICVSTQYE